MEVIDDRIKGNIEVWKRNLLDITSRNQSINFRRRKSSTIQIIFPSMGDFLDEMVSSRGVSFAELFDDEEEDEEIEDLLDEEEAEEFITLYGIRLPRKEIYDAQELLPVIKEFISRKKGKFLFSNVNNRNQRKVLRNLMKKARSFKEENAINVLYFSVGYLEWFESKDSDVSHKAPLMYVSTELSQESFDAPFKVSFSEGDLLLNDSLIQKMIRDFSLDISFDINQSEGQLSELYNQYQQFVISKCPDKRWTIHNEIDLGIFSFSKINMVKDLEENEALISSNLLVQQMSGMFEDNDNEPIFDEEIIDKLINPIEYYHILNADSSQEIAIQSAIAGKSFVLQGPPGTGKSQTITNIITELIARNKKVLFVAEKKAALDVVYNNLRKIGLNDYALPIHNSKLDKKEVVRELAETLEKGQSQIRVDEQFASQQIAKFSDARTRLINYREELLRIRYPINKSLYDLYGVFLKYNKEIDLKFEIQGLDKINQEKLLHFESIIRAFHNASKAIGFSESKHPWYGLKHSKLSLAEKEGILDRLVLFQQSVQEAKSNLDDIDCLNIDYKSCPFSFILSSLKAFLEHLLKIKRTSEDIVNDTRLNEDVALYEKLVSLFRTSEELGKRVSAKYDMKVLDTDVDRYYRITKKHSGWLRRVFSREFKTVRNEITLYKHDPKIKYRELVSDLLIMNELLDTRKQYQLHSESTQYKADFHSGSAIENTLYDLSWYAEFVNLKETANLSFVNGDFKGLSAFIQERSRRVTQIEKYMQIFEKAFPLFEIVQTDYDISKTQFRALTIENLFHTLDQKINHFDDLETYLNYNLGFHNARENGLEGFCTKTVTENIQERYFEIFLRRFYLLLIDKYLGDIFPGFDGSALDLVRKSFAEAEQTMQQMAKKVVEKNITDEIPNYNGLEGYNAEVAALRAEANKSRRIMPFRLLFRKIPNLILKLKPCLMMSPLSVSTFLRNSDMDFDTVIFDEASQVKPENAIGAISRAKQFIISGDKEQLPPTIFFQNIDDEEVDSEENYDTSAFDSILEVSSGFMNSIKLRWHYRSKFEELIRPSNKEIYNDLITFPSPTKPTQYEGIQFIRVNGLYVNRQNDVEANKVIDLLHDLIVKSKGQKSIGIVTFNSEQQSLIERKTNHFRRTHPEYEAFFTNHEVEPFFIKNIESVQGDERDIIIITIGYGPDGQGRISMNFGPLNQTNGYRRLNVAVTRAKSCLYLVSSMSGADIDLNRTKSRGAAFLKHYLEYAEFGEDEKVDTIDEFAQFDSPFEKDVYNALVEMGYTVKMQVGCSGYRIDLAVVNPDNPTNFILGIECDGATYHSSKSVRDRDQLRQQVLEDRNWTIYRIWSTDWIKNRSQQVNKLKEFLSKIHLQPKSNETFDLPSIPTITMERETLEVQFREYPNYDMMMRSFSSSWSRFYLQNNISAIISETTPLHMNELKKIVPAFWGRQKYTSVVDGELQPILRSLVHLGQIKREGNFYLVPNAKIEFQRTTEKSTRRDFYNIHPEEIRNGITSILQITKIMKRDDLISMITKYCGYATVSGNIRDHITRVLHNLVNEKVIVIENDTVDMVG